ncbi:MAG TPA: AAA family ATPase, partial [Candidatus Acidoferrum sp.]
CKLAIQLGEEISWNRRGESGRYHTSCKATQPAPIQPIQGSDPLAAILAGSLQPYLSIQREEITEELDARISERINEALATLPKETSTVYFQNGQHIGTIDGLKHELFDEVCMLVSMRKSVFLWGEAGSGKSTAAKKMADLLGLPFYYVALQAQMTASVLMGYVDAHGEYVESDLYRAYTQGGVFLLDELALGSGNLLGSLNGALANGHASFPRGRNSGGLVKRHADFICIATDNTPGTGATIQFSDRRALDNSVRDRFHFIEWNTDKRMELALAKAIFDRSEAWVKWVQDVRQLATNRYPKLVCTQRASLEGCELLAAGLQPARVAEMLVFRGADRTTVGAILAAHPLPLY